MVVSGYLLFKKGGPFVLSSGKRKINWKCKVPGCPYYVQTVEGLLREEEWRAHNHESQAELVASNELRHHLKKKIAHVAMTETPMSEVVMDTLLEESELDLLNKVGNLDALRQAARRYKRKLLKKDEVAEPVFVDPATENVQLDWCLNCSSGNFSSSDGCDCDMKTSENPLEIVKNELVDK